MNLLIKQIVSETSVRRVHTVTDLDSGKDLTGLQSITFEVNCHDYPTLTMTSIGDIEFEGDCHVVIKRVARNSEVRT